MEFSKELVNGVKKYFPNNEFVIECAEKGNMLLEKVLYESKTSYPYQLIYRCFGEYGFSEDGFAKVVEVVQRKHDEYMLLKRAYNEFREYRNNCKNPDDMWLFRYSKEVREEVKRLYPDNEKLEHDASIHGDFLIYDLEQFGCGPYYENIYELVTDETKTKEEKYNEMMENAHVAKMQDKLDLMCRKEVSEFVERYKEDETL